MVFVSNVSIESVQWKIGGMERISKKLLRFSDKNVVPNNNMKKQLTSIPSHYRQLKNNELYKPNDLYTDGWVGTFQKCNGSGNVSSWPSYKFFRRKHVRTVVAKQPVVEKPVAPLVMFQYPMKGQDWMPPKVRTVRLIAADSNYLVGLELTNKDGKDHWQYKKFLRFKVKNLAIVEFNPSAIK
jgi:hypothetical protein